MGLIRPSTLLLATLMASPAIYQALIAEQLSIQSALTRFLLAVPAAALMLAALRLITSGYGDRRQRRMPLRRRTDPPPAEGT